MSHAEKADKLLIKPAAGARPAPPRTRGQIIPKARNAASHPTSHKQHGDTRWRRPQTDDPTVLQSPCECDASGVSRSSGGLEERGDGGGLGAVIVRPAASRPRTLVGRPDREARPRRKRFSGSSLSAAHRPRPDRLSGRERDQNGLRARDDGPDDVVGRGGAGVREIGDPARRLHPFQRWSCTRRPRRRSVGGASSGAEVAVGGIGRRKLPRRGAESARRNRSR